MKPETGRFIPGPTGQPMIVRIDGEASRGAYSVIEYSHAAGAQGPPAHVHHRREEASYVIDGELTLLVGSESIVLGPGDTAVVPRGIVHQPSNKSDNPVRFIFISSPPMDEFFIALSKLVADTNGTPPARELTELGALRQHLHRPCCIQFGETQQ